MRIKFGAGKAVDFDISTSSMSKAQSTTLNIGYCPPSASFRRLFSGEL